MSKKGKLCPTCGQHVREYNRRVTSGLADALVKFKQAVLYYGRNDIDPSVDMGRGSPFELSYVQRVNITVLRIHGLVAKVKHSSGSRKTGHWLLTDRGSKWLKGEIVIPERVVTFQNAVVRHSEETVSIKDVLGSEPRFDDINTIEYEDVPPATLDSASAAGRTLREKQLKSAKGKDPLAGRMQPLFKMPEKPKPKKGGAYG